MCHRIVSHYTQPFAVKCYKLCCPVWVRVCVGVCMCLCVCVTFSFATLWENGQVPSACLHVPLRNLQIMQKQCCLKLLVNWWTGLFFIVDYSFDQNKFISTMRSLVALVSQLTIKLTSNNKANRNHLMDVSESNQKSLISTAVSM